MILRNSATVGIAAMAFLAMLPNSGAATQILLDAHFDDKELDQPIGTGGAAVGEPIFVYPTLNAIVRNEPGSAVNQELELSAGPGASTLSAWFELLELAEITEGVLNIRGEFVLEGADAFTDAHLYVRRQGSSASDFASVALQNSGVLSLAGSGIVGQTWPDQVQLNARNEIELQFDMDAGRYWLWFNGQPMGPPEGYAHGITEHGIGRVIAGLGVSADAPRSARLDNLQVVWTPGDALFADGFEAPPPD